MTARRDEGAALLTMDDVSRRLGKCTRWLRERSTVQSCPAAPAIPLEVKGMVGLSVIDLSEAFGRPPHEHGRQTRAKGVRYDRDSFARPTLPGGR